MLRLFHKIYLIQDLNLLRYGTIYNKQKRTGINLLVWGKFLNLHSAYY